MKLFSKVARWLRVKGTARFHEFFQLERQAGVMTRQVQRRWFFQRQFAWATQAFDVPRRARRRIARRRLAAQWKGLADYKAA